MKVANKKNLTTHAEQLLGNNYSPERAAELVNVCLNGYERQSGHSSHSEAAHLEKIDNILGNYGVEGFTDPVEVMYSNAGDTYTLTILYFREKLRIGTWGDIVDLLLLKTK